MDAFRLAKKTGVDFKIEDRRPASNTSVADVRRDNSVITSGALFIMAANGIGA